MTWALRGRGHSAPAGLGHRPALDQREAEPALENLVVARVDAGAEAELQAVRALRRLRIELEENGRHDAEIVHDGRSRIRHGAPPATGVEAVERHDRAAVEDHRHRRARQCIHVKHRQRRQQNLGAILQGRHAALRHVPAPDAEKVLVGENTTFRPAGRAGGEQERAGIIASGRARRRWARAARRRLVGRDQRKRRIGGADEPMVRRQCNGELRLYDTELVGQIRRLQLGIERVDRDAQAVERKPGPEEFRSVFHEQRDPRPASVTGGREPLPHGLETIQHLPIGVRKSGRRIGELRGGGCDQKRGRGCPPRARNESIRRRYCRAVYCRHALDPPQYVLLILSLSDRAYSTIIDAGTTL